MGTVLLVLLAWSALFGGLLCVLRVARTADEKRSAALLCLAAQRATRPVSIDCTSGEREYQRQRDRWVADLAARGVVIDELRLEEE